jgi:AraC-like DNA-binding protein
VITLAKKMIETQQELSLKHIAYQLGFTEPSSFYRYFKHATGITAKDYHEAHRNATIAAKANDGK